MFSRTIRSGKTKGIRNYFVKEEKRNKKMSDGISQDKSISYTNWRPTPGWAIEQCAFVNPSASIARILLSNGGKRESNCKITEK